MRSQQVTIVTPEVIDSFRSSLSVKGRSPRTVKAYTTDLKMFLLATRTDEGAMAVLTPEFEELAASWLTMNRGKVSPKTTTRRLTSLRAFARWAGWPDVLSDYSVPTPAKGQPHPLPEGIDGVRRLIAASKVERDKTLIALCGLVGLRISEALQVRPSHFNLNTMMLTVRGKGDKTRVVPVSSEAWDVISMCVARAFSANKDACVVQLTDRAARRIVTRLGAVAGLQRSISSHDLRATFGTAVFDHTKDIRVVQELLGHGSVSTTELYTGVSQQKMREAVEL